MKKKMSICFFVGLFIGILVIISIQLLVQVDESTDNEHSTEIVSATEQDVYTTNETEEYVSSMSLTGNEKYFLKEQEGYLIVYEVNTDEIFCETNICVRYLPEEIQEKLESGFYFTREKDLYDFLESYSS